MSILSIWRSHISRNMMSEVSGVSKRFWLQCVFIAVLQYQNGRSTIPWLLSGYRTPFEYWIKMLFPTRVEADPDKMVMISRDAAFTENPMERLTTNFLYYKICYWQYLRYLLLYWKATTRKKDSLYTWLYQIIFPGRMWRRTWELTALPHCRIYIRTWSICRQHHPR